MKKRKRSKFEAVIGKSLPKKTLYEPFSILYIKNHKYIPDYVLPNGIIVEVKGRFTSSDRMKHRLIREQAGDTWDIRFVFMRDNKLNKNSNTSYTEWCAKYGFKCSVGKVPPSWLKE